MPLSQGDPTLDYGGSWGDASEGWPEITFATEEETRVAYVVAWRDAKVPYGSYVLVGNALRLETQALKKRVERHLKQVLPDVRKEVLQGVLSSSKVGHAVIEATLKEIDPMKKAKKSKSATKKGTERSAKRRAAPKGKVKRVVAAVKGLKKELARDSVAILKDVALRDMDKSPIGKRDVNRAALIRALPTGMPAKTVIGKLAAKGVKVTESYVYNVRGTAKKAALKKKLAKSGSYGVPAPTTFIVGGMGGGSGKGAPGPLSPEELLMAVASEVGLSRAILILTSARLVVASALTSHSEPGK